MLGLVRHTATVKLREKATFDFAAFASRPQLQYIPGSDAQAPSPTQPSRARPRPAAYIEIRIVYETHRMQEFVIVYTMMGDPDLSSVYITRQYIQNHPPSPIASRLKKFRKFESYNWIHPTHPMDHVVPGVSHRLAMRPISSSARHDSVVFRTIA